MLKIKQLLAAVPLLIVTGAQAKTVNLMCETMAASQSQVAPGPAGIYTGRDASYSTWGVSIETDDEGKIKRVTLDNEDREFEQRGDALKFRAKLIFSLEINLKTGRARTTVTGFDTREQGGCRVVSKTEKGLLD
jgi:hypothetical protein